MAKLEMYAIKDTVIGEHMNIILLHNDEEAKRTFAEAVNSGNNQSQIVKNYKDMQMFGLGTYDTITGETTSKVRYIASGVEVKKAPEPIPQFTMNYKPEVEEKQGE